MSWVWDHSGAAGGELLLLLAIADHASDDGTNAYPSVGTLARKCRVHTRTVQRQLRNLQELGAITITEHGGKIEGRTKREQPNAYTVVMVPLADCRLVATEAEPPWQIAADPPGTDATQNTLLEPPQEQSPTPRAADAFAAFWQAYPRGDGKPAAVKAWAKAVSAATPERIMEGLAAWVAYWQARAQPEYVPWAQKWLNQHQWNAVPPHVQRGQGGQRGPITLDRQQSSGEVTDL